MEILPDDDDIPHARSGHVAVVWREHMYLWGGYDIAENGVELWLDPKVIWKYNMNNKKWYRHKIVNGSPPPCMGYCCACWNGRLVVFGGHGRGLDFNDVWILHLSEMKWEFPQTENLRPSERNKTACCIYKNRLIVFGGYGPPPLPRHHFTNGDFDIDDDSYNYDRGWNNDLVAYDLDEDTWTELSSKGDKPLPRAAHAMTTIGSKAYVYGGRHLYERLGDLYSLCLDTYQWTSINFKFTSSIPIGRSWHSLTASSDTDLFLFGGVDTARNTLSDGWIFNVATLVWRKAPIAEECRMWHTACRDAWDDILIFGGCSTNIFVNEKHSNKLTRYNLLPKSLTRICLEMLVLHPKTWSGRTDFLPLSLHRRLSKMSEDGG